MLHMLLACAKLVSVTADLTARDVETLAALIGASEKRMSVAISDAIVASEKRMSVAISDAIVASETKLQKFMVDILRDESHLFIKHSARQTKACVHFINNDVTGFGVVFNDRGYFVIPNHTANEGNRLSHTIADLALLHPSSSGYKNSFGFFNLTNAIANPSMGDTLFALGYDSMSPHVGLRLWVGSVYSVFDHHSVTVCSAVQGTRSTANTTTIEC